jgi:hypothetical protein
MHTAEPLVPELISFKMNLLLKSLKTYKSSGTDQTAAELIQAGSDALGSEIHRLNNLFGTRKNCQNSGRSGPTQSPIQCVPGALSLVVKRPGRQVDHSPLSSAEVKNDWT